MRKLARELRDTDKYEVRIYFRICHWLIIHDYMRAWSVYAVNFSTYIWSVYHVAILQNEQYQNKMKQSDERLLALVKAAMDVVVAIGLLQLAPKKVTPRMTGAFGFITSLISCYQVLLPLCCWLFVHVLFRNGSAMLMFRVLYLHSTATSFPRSCGQSQSLSSVAGLE